MAEKGFSSQTWTDYDGEHSNVRVHCVPLTAANFDAQATLRAALNVAVANITLGVLHKNMYGGEDLVSNNKATDVAAQRELKWLVSYIDDTTMTKYSIEIPTADVAQLDPNDRAHAEIGDAGVVDAFVTAFEAFARSPVGNSVTVEEITLVGRML